MDSFGYPIVPLVIVSRERTGIFRTDAPWVVATTRVRIGVTIGAVVAVRRFMVVVIIAVIIISILLFGHVGHKGVLFGLIFHVSARARQCTVVLSQVDIVEISLPSRRHGLDEDLLQLIILEATI